ncbi:MAG: serine protease [Moritella sp.]|uniref:S1 family peptidase n=1 Tax=Moritella sp. TaxID=78556 RepID=UPI0029B61BD2|nr:serine protease [Moritella sp.]MDX2322485.1 serine protease [Moritella sp.]
MLAKIIAITGITLSLSAYADEIVLTEPEIQPYVVGGVNSKPLELPWQVYLNIGVNGSTYACGGTLVTDTWVLTAAHCLNANIDDSSFVAVIPSKVTVYSGSIDRSSTGEMVRNTVSTVVVHPSYNPTLNINDIALLQLTLPAVLPAQPIKLMNKKLQSDADLEFDAAVGNNLLVSGWGRTSTDASQSTDILQKAIVTGITDRSCALTWGWNGREDNYICANEIKRGSCNGDSGGPLIWQDKLAQSDDDLGYRLAGVVSFGNTKQCAYDLFPDVYTQVSSYKTWITDEVDKTGVYIEPNPTFNQNIFAAENKDDNDSNNGKKGGGVSYSSLLILMGLMLYRTKHRR